LNTHAILLKQSCRHDSPFVRVWPKSKTRMRFRLTTVSIIFVKARKALLTTHIMQNLFWLAYSSKC